MKKRHKRLDAEMLIRFRLSTTSSLKWLAKLTLYSLKWLLILTFFATNEANPAANSGHQNLPSCSKCETSVSPKHFEQLQKREARRKSSAIRPAPTAKSQHHCTCRPSSQKVDLGDDSTKLLSLTGIPDVPRRNVTSAPEPLHAASFELRRGAPT